MPDATRRRHASSRQPSFLARSSRPIGTVGLLLICAMVLVSCANAPNWGTSVGTAADSDGCAPTSASGEALTRAQIGDAVLCLVNRQRASRGIGSLRVSQALARAATRHSADMVASGNFSHVSSRGETLRQRAVRAGYVGRRLTLGETIAWGSGSYGTATEIVESFMQSPNHRQIVLGARFRDAGVGVALGAPEPGVGGDAATVTIDFGRR